MRKGKVVMIVATDGEPGVELEDMGPNVKWVTMPQETFDKIMNFLEHPETGVRLGRPERKSDSDQGNPGDGGPGGPRRGDRD